jgi:hypothetical protein
MIPSLIALAVILIAVGGASFYIIKAKKSGKKCIGCPESGGCCNCPHSSANKK